ncbi:MAG: DUF2442 domain-containing protein [Campylobacterales bacterium]|nr:DUF2442 domain-containing protein [Campylobacterales bacterium]
MIQPNQIIAIEQAEYRGDYKIRLVFNDEKIQIIDFYNFIDSSYNPEIVKYKDLELFKQFSITDGDLEWNDYDFCFPISDLYENKNIGTSNDDSNVAA